MKNAYLKIVCVAAVIFSMLGFVSGATAPEANIDIVDFKQINPGNHRPATEQKVTVYMYNNDSQQTAQMQLNMTHPNGSVERIGTISVTLDQFHGVDLTYTVPNSSMQEKGIYTFNAKDINDDNSIEASFNYKIVDKLDTMELALLLAVLGATFFFAILGKWVGEDDDSQTDQARMWGKIFRQMFYMLSIIFLAATLFVGGELARETLRFDYLSSFYNKLMLVPIVLIILLVVLMVWFYIQNALKTATGVDDEVEGAL